MVSLSFLKARDRDTDLGTGYDVGGWTRIHKGDTILGENTVEQGTTWDTMVPKCCIYLDRVPQGGRRGVSCKSVVAFVLVGKEWVGC